MRGICKESVSLFYSLPSLHNNEAIISFAYLIAAIISMDTLTEHLRKRHEKKYL